MADLSDLTAEIEQIVTSAGASEEVTKKIRDGLATVVANTHLVTDSIGRMQQAFSDSSGSITTGLFDIEELFGNVGDAIRDNTDGISSFGLKSFLALEPLIGILEKGSIAFGNFGSSGREAGISITEGFQGIQPILEKLRIPGVGILANMAESADAAQGLETGLLRAAAESGQLDEMLGAASEGLGKMPDLMAQYNTWVERAADSSGKLSSEVTKWGELLLKIPGAMEQTVAVQTHAEGDQTTQLSLLDATIKVANGTRQTEAEVLASLTMSYRKLNVTGKDALEWIAKMGVVADDANIPIDIMRESVARTADTYKLFGNNTQGAISIMGQFAQALRGSNLGPEGIQEVVDGITGGIQKMDIAQRAFISAASGGRGGVAGGLQVEFLLQQGKLGDVQKKAQEAITRQFGGPTLTLEQANQNPALAGKFLQQREMVKQFGLATTDQGANRVLEAWSKGLTAAPERTGAQALQQAVERGTSIQEAQRNVLTDTRNILLELTRQKAVQMLAALRALEPPRSAEQRMQTEGEGFIAANAGVAGAEERRTGNLASVAETFERAKSRLVEIGSNVASPFVDKMEEKKAQIEQAIEAATATNDQGALTRLAEQKRAIEQQIQAVTGFGGRAPETAGDVMAPVPPRAVGREARTATTTAAGEDAHTLRIRVDITDSINTLVSKAVKAYYTSQGVTGSSG